MAGQVRADGEIVVKPSSSVPIDAQLAVDSGPEYVSRGGDKLKAALLAFHLNVNGKVCADVGASTGGFSDCLLQSGAARVYAIDVGKGILHWKLRQDPRVVVMESTNARYLEHLPEPVELVTIDVSFISSKILFPVVKNWLPETGGQLILLIKPQFEAGKSETARGSGVIRDSVIHRRVMEDILGFAQGLGFSVQDLIRSPLYGPKGNIEFLAFFVYPKEINMNPSELIERCVSSQVD
jgi:23S rRNA (cytidine1920-2'-O)/16S rRNA (cytidine1409-2'-O)-methyltransferase